MRKSYSYNILYDNHNIKQFNKKDDINIQKIIILYEMSNNDDKAKKNISYGE